MTRPVVRNVTAARMPVDSARQDWIAEYLATKYGVAQVAPLLFKLYVFIEERGRPADTDTVDRWLIEEVSNKRRPTPTTETPYVQPNAVVYYVLFGDRVKIGTTTKLRKRLTAIPHDRVLATEPGSYDVERQRHAQFRHLREGRNREWFRYEAELVDHIRGLQPDPD